MTPACPLSYDDPNSLCGLVFVRGEFSARILYHFLKDLARSDVEFSFLTPQYATGELKEVSASSRSDH